MAVPKKKTSKRRSANRTSANMKANKVVLSKCEQCGELKPQHVVCHVCGFYGGKKVLDIESKLDKKIRKSSSAKAADGQGTKAEEKEEGR